ncbi:uncharacterized protein DUF1524 [Propionicimonas paludicola]|uniref:Uncharacterized protein DUF1524 n=1 Tax=Propionicimonas paludicola TaxID=185243 RepID=A0A2A9CNT3_9ACTN|nr:HNH endonuclease family protein [Propionicimonas paludicola]PFG16117.1 uncharacterized protein DUF1524 [Propionicimonas paludicola]
MTMRSQLDVQSRTWRATTAIIVAVMALAGCQQSTAPSVIPKPTRSTSAHPTGAPSATGQTWTSSAADIAAARAALPALQVREPRRGNADYRRIAFGPAWTDTDHNGCNQRDDVLLRDVARSAPYRVGTQRGCDHDLLAGTWIDPYSGTPTTLTDAKSQQQAPLVQIDHIVALSVAWRDGARDWTDDQRLTFANDLRNLVATSGATNQAKGGSDAASWRPIPSAQCTYAVRYVGIKAAYALAITPAESDALAGMLHRCG